MRYISAIEWKTCGFESHEKFFLECWYGFTHKHSLDSYRANCLNSRTIVRELNEELKLGLLDDPELKGLCAEVSKLLQLDEIVKSAMPKCLKVLRPLLDNPPSMTAARSKDNNDNPTRLRDLRFAISDLSASLESRYLDGLRESIRKTVEAKSTVGLAAATSSFLSDLVDRGWPLQTLHFWHRHFFTEKDHTFLENLDFVLRQVCQPSQTFDVTLRINSATKLKKLEEFGRFRLSRTCDDLLSESKEEKRFTSSDNYVVFAKGTVHGVDAVSAAIAAREEFESLVDIASFELLRTTLKIDERSYVVRHGEGSNPRLPLIDNPVPNPTETFDENDFKSFSTKLAAVLGSNALDEETKNRVRTAFRQYRFGRECQNYSDKFLNWWMGLETLAKVDGDKIGRTITKNISHAMLTGYLERILKDLLVTLQKLKLNWHTDFTNACKDGSWKNLSIQSLILVLRDQTALGQLITLLVDRPFVASTTQKIAAYLAQPGKTADQLECHLSRIQWHLDRLYRIRCCIVHGSPVRFRMVLLTAALEYYLKQSLEFVLNALHKHTHFTDLACLYQRCTSMWERTLKVLKDTQAKPEAIDEAVFANVALTA